MTSILIAGPGLGNMILPLAFSLFIRIYGWRTAYQMLGGTVFVVLLIGALFLRRDPGDVGLKALGKNPESETAGGGFQKTGLTLREALRTNQYWLLSCIYFCDFFVMNVILVHIVIHAQDQGIPITEAAGVLSVASAVCIFARVIVGGIADRLGYKPTFLFCLFTGLCGLLLLTFADRLWLLYAFAVIFGFSLWSSGGLIGPMIAKLFGLRAHGAVYGSIFVSGGAGGAFGPVLAGYLYDLYGNYLPAFLLCIGINVLSILSLLSLKPLAAATSLDTAMNPFPQKFKRRS